jgi:hypothetical protein
MGLRNGFLFWFVNSQSDKEKQVVKKLYQGYQSKRIKNHLPDLGKIHAAKIRNENKLYQLE